ncbi:MAG: hypothetical protein K6A97_00770 [Lachnospiraceae bacterium]|nr:hypothetical protein [Lachnospiraceae bacterium]
MSEKRKRLWLRFAAACVLAFNIALCLSLPLYADMGPKPSVTLKIKNAPEGRYAVGLLEKNSNGYRDDDQTYSNVEDMNRAMFDKMMAYEEDGWSIAFAPGRTPFIGFPNEYGNTRSEFKYTYYAPSHFKIILVTGEDGAEYVSNEIETTRYEAACYYDFKTGVLAEDLEKYEQDDKSYFRRSVSFCVGTLIMEGLLLFAFGLGQLRNIPVFLIANVLTQFYLHATLWGNYKAYGPGGWGNLVIFLGNELLILIVETVLYAIFMKQENGKHGRIVAYGILANILSLFGGLFAQTIVR